MGILNILKKIIDPLGAWMETASDQELADEYEKRRLAWLKAGGGMKTPEMEQISREISRRSAEKRKNDPWRSKDPNYRWTDANRWDND